MLLKALETNGSSLLWAVCDFGGKWPKKEIMTNHPNVGKYTIYHIPGSSRYVKFLLFHLKKKLPKGRNFTYLEDPGII